jgi:ribonuclease P protein component
VGFVAGRRVGGAVVRNRAKRRLREAARRVALEADTSYVVIAEPGIGEATFDHLVEWVRSAAAPEEGKGR